MLLCCLDERFLYFPCLYHNFCDIFRRQNLLKESYRLMEIRKLLRNYGLPNFNLYNSTEIMVMFWIRVIFGHLLCCGCFSSSFDPVFPSQTLIRYILKQDQPTSLQDALTLAEAYKLPTSQIIYLYFIQLIGQGKVCSAPWREKPAPSRFSLFLCL